MESPPARTDNKPQAAGVYPNDGDSSATDGQQSTVKVYDRPEKGSGGGMGMMQIIMIVAVIAIIEAVLWSVLT